MAQQEQELRCSFCLKPRSKLADADLLVVAGDGRTCICHSCVAVSQGLCAEKIRKDNWKKGPLLREVK